ncbi:MAG: sulfite exporter TauE/SafE family protein, partial [Acidobacteria bacterium]|nr:sulfite exporter TauE/SafE family protein [Acidobacteriota bacterium]
THFTHLVPPRILMLIFAGVLLVVGTLMLTRRNALTCSQPCLPPRCFTIAFSIGLLTGLLGVGGGFLLVPALMRFAGLQARAAAGTSLALISLNSFVGLAGQLRFVSLDWAAAASMLVFAVVGLVAGLALAPRMQGDHLKRALAVLLVAIGLGIGIANLAAMA